MDYGDFDLAGVGAGSSVGGDISGLNDEISRINYWVILILAIFILFAAFWISSPNEEKKH